MSSVRGTSSLLGVSKRYASTKAALAREPIRVSTTGSGLKVATLDDHGPIARVAAVVKSGARDEAHGQAGASHALRVCSSLATRNYSQFGLSRNLNQIGAELTITSNREETTYLLEATRDHLSRGVDILAEIISRPELRHWEVSDAKNRLNFDLDVYDQRPELKVVELIHKAAFKNGLDKSLYAPRYNLGNLNNTTLEEFRSQTFNTNNLTLIGTGVKHEELVQYSDLFRLSGKAGAARTKSSYNGGEIREENSSQLVHVVLAAEGASAAAKEALIANLICHAYGTGGPRVKYSAGASIVEKIGSAIATSPIAVSAFNASYSDSGFLGYHIVADKKDIGKVTKAVYQESRALASKGLTEADLARAKNSYKMSLAVASECSQGVIDNIAKNPDNANNNLNLNEVFKTIDAVSLKEFNAGLAHMSANKLSMAAVGDLSELPRLEEIELKA